MQHFFDEKKQKRTAAIGGVFVAVIVIIIVGLLGFVFGYLTPRNIDVSFLPTKIQNAFQEQANTNTIDPQVFSDVWQRVTNEYLRINTVSGTQLYYGMMKGLVAGLGDPYSIFLDPEETKQFAQDLQGTFEGIGAELTIKDDQLTVVAPLAGSPAQEAGLLPNDIITHINGQPSAYLDLDTAVSRIRGENGTQVTLTIQREGLRSFDLPITRRAIHIDSVTYARMDNDIALVTIRSFSDDTKSVFDKAVQDILLKETKGIILDMRNNPGGLLDVSAEIANEFLKQGDTIVIERTGSGEETKTTADRDGKLVTIPVVVLVNEGSASAAEIVAGALQDNDRAQIVGKNSFGKGTVQTYEELSDGSSLKITVAEWLTPKGASIEEQGITPDVIVEMTENEYSESKDPQMDKAKALVSM